MNTWNIAVAKSGFSEMVEDARQEPQIITKRNRPVAVVMDISTYDSLGADKRKVPSVADLLGELRAIQKDETALIDIPARKDRKITI